MSIRYLFGGAAIVAIALSATAIAQSTNMQGTVTGVEEGGRKVMLKMADGKTATVNVSGSRTKVMVGGKEGSRDAIKAGMTCTAMGAAGADATSLDCK